VHSRGLCGAVSVLVLRWEAAGPGRQLFRSWMPTSP